MPAAEDDRKRPPPPTTDGGGGKRPAGLALPGSRAVHFLKECSLKIAKEVGEDHFISAVETALARGKSTKEECGDVEDIMEKHKELYQSLVGTGQENAGVINCGVDWAISLQKSHHTIEAERLLANQVEMSQRVLGPDHATTARAVSQLEECRARHVTIPSRNGKQFLALGYEVDTEVYTVRDMTTEETFSVAKCEVDLSKGTPVICYGLMKATHLNGRIGEVRAFDEPSQSYKVHFECERLRPCLVRGQFLRILFELPPGTS